MKRCNEALNDHRFLALIFCRNLRFIASSLPEFASIALMLEQKKH
jgi:hypothetical protein